MGAAHSRDVENSKLPLAERRYRVSEPRAAAAVQRRSTRKLGSVALELKEHIEHIDVQIPGTSCSTAAQSVDEARFDEAVTAATSREEASGSREESPGREELNLRKPSRIMRQRRADNFQLTRTENSANVGILLTRTQRVLIENSWKRAKKGAAEGRMGDRIFHTILMAQPDIKLLFGLEKVPQGRLKYEGHFRRHSGLLNRSLEYIVKNLQYTEKLDQHFQNLGKKHCQMNGGRAFPTHYWDTFLECITQSILECDGASGGRQHRCRETAMAWRSLISFIVQQMRRGFDDERLMRKRFSASLMGLRGINSSSNTTLLHASYGTGSERAKAATGRPRPSIIHQHHHHSHGSLGSLEMLPLSSQYHSLSLSMSNPYGSRARAASAISPLAIGQHNSKGSIGAGQSSEDEQFVHLMPQSSPSNTSSARSASWCAEVAAENIRRLQVSEGQQPRTAKSELNIDNETGEVFYTPRMTRNEALMSPQRRENNNQTNRVPPPKPALAAVQLLLNAASSEGQMGGERAGPPGILLSRHSFSDFAPNGEGETTEQGKREGKIDGNTPEFLAAVQASQKLLGLAHCQHGADGSATGDSSPNQPRRLSAL